MNYRTFLTPIDTVSRRRYSGNDYPAQKVEHAVN